MSLMIRGSMASYLLLRMSELVTFPRESTNAWTPFEYVEFMVNSDNETLRLRRQLAHQKKHDADPGHHDLQKSQAVHHASQKPKRSTTTVAYAEMNRQFYTRVTIEMAGLYALFAVTCAYVDKYPYEFDAYFVSPLDLAGVLPNLMLGIMLYCQLHLTYTMWRIPVTMLLRLPFTPLFNSPLKSTSLRDFWSHRWNTVIQSVLHRVAFKPTLAFVSQNHTCCHMSGKHSCMHRSFHLRVASVVTFVASAVYHEYMIAMFMPNESHGSNFSFFLLHGVLCLAQIKAQKWTGFGISWGKGVGWDVMGGVVTWLVVLATSPLFAGAFARSGLLATLPVPMGVVQWIQSYI
ncbi:hypothetical protein HDU98_000995 [Podochytrium sp. JEL0797]|nr:hypothetical protein HDU98_000995 [Podochytrium sp. JEL0797]